VTRDHIARSGDGRWRAGSSPEGICSGGQDRGCGAVDSESRQDPAEVPDEVGLILMEKS
jgi:hypothetical protein